MKMTRAEPTISISDENLIMIVVVIVTVIIIVFILLLVGSELLLQNEYSF